MICITDFLAHIRLTMKLQEQMLKNICETWQLTITEGKVISFLYNNPGKDTAADITELRMLSKGNVSQAVESLIQKGLLKRTADQTDRRKIHLSLLPQTADITAAICSMQANLYSQIFCGLSEEDLKFYEQINQQIMENTKKRSKKGRQKMNLQQKKDNSFLATEPLGKLLLKLSLPTVTAQIINMLYNIVDRIYIGHIPENGALALTGVGVCMPLIMIVSAFAALVGNGGAPRASIFMGKGDKESAERTLGNCFTTQIIVSLLLTIILFTGNRSFLMAFGASENTIPYAVAYMNIYSLGTIFVQLTLGMNAFITAQGFARTGMLSVLVGAASNIILDPVFIFVFHMGVRGAALATIISQALSCAWVLNFLTGKNRI